MNFAVSAAYGVLLLLVAVLALFGKFSAFIKFETFFLTEILKLRFRISRRFAEILLVIGEIWKMCREIYPKWKILKPKMKRKTRIRTFLKVRSRRAANRNWKNGKNYLFILVKPTGLAKLDQENPEKARARGESYFYDNL